MPTQPNHLILYLAFLGKTANSFSVVNLACSAIAWGHKLSGYASPTTDPLVLEVVEGLKRKLGAKVHKKEPFKLQEIHKLVDMGDLTSLTKVRNLSLMYTAFYGFLRYDEIAALKCNQVKFLGDRVELFIPKSKRDQLREGSTLPIARLSGDYCPVAFLLRYLSMTKAVMNSNMYVFRRVIAYKEGFCLNKANVAISYSSVRDFIKDAAIGLGLDPKDYGTHSLRAGGSSAAANAGVADRLFQRHGRWASVSAKDGYIKDSMASRLSVTLNMT